MLCFHQRNRSRNTGGVRALKIKKGRKIRSELNPDVSVSKQGRRIVLKGNGLIEIAYPRTKYKRLPKRITLGGA